MKLLITIILLFSVNNFVYSITSSDSLKIAGKVQYADGKALDSIKISLFDSKGVPSNILFTDTEGNFFADSVITNIQNNSLVLPKDYKLNQNFPNQFAKRTNITYEIAAQDNTAQAKTVNLKIYNVLGKEIKDLSSEYKGAGAYGVQWDGTNNKGIDVAEGVYFARLSLGEYSKVIKMAKVDGAANASGLTIPHPTENLTLSKTNEETFTAIIEDLKGEAKSDTAMFVVPNDKIIHTLEEKMNVAEKNYNMKEGATLAIPKSNWAYTTGAVTEFQNLSAAYEMWEDADNIYLTTVDPNANGSLGALIQTIAPHQTENLTNLNISIDDMTNFYFQVQDIVNHDSTITSPAILTINGQDFANDNGSISGKYDPNSNLDISVTAPGYRREYIINSNDGQFIRYNKVRTTETLDLSQDITGTLGLEPTTFEVDGWERILNTSGTAGTDIFRARQDRDADVVALDLDIHNAEIPTYNDTIVNVYIWTGPGNLPGKFATFAPKGSFAEAVQMTEENIGLIEDIVRNELPGYLDNFYKINTHIVPDSALALRLIEKANGDTVAFPEKSSIIVYAGSEDSHVGIKLSDYNELNSAVVILRQKDGRPIPRGTAISEIYAEFAESNDYDDPNHPSKDYSFFSAYSIFSEPTAWDKNVVRMHLRKLKEGWRHFD